MNSKPFFAVFVLLFAVNTFARAEDAAEMPAGETPIAEMPGVTATTTVTGADKAEVTCLVKAGAGKDAGCAANYRPVADAYLSGYKAMDGWIAGASAQVAGAEEKVVKAEGAVRENETAMTALKLDRSKDAKAKLKDLSVQNKQLWKDLEAARREQAAVCKNFKREVMQKVKELNAAVGAALTEAQKAE